MADLVHPYDLFFKIIFSHLDLAEDALTNYISRSIFPLFVTTKSKENIQVKFSAYSRDKEKRSCRG